MKRSFLLLFAIPLIGFAAVWTAIAVGAFTGGRGSSGGPFTGGMQLLAAGVAGLSWLMAVVLVIRAVRGRLPGSDDAPSRISEAWSTAQAGTVTTYRQAVGRGIVNLLAGAVASVMVVGAIIAGVSLPAPGMALVGLVMGALIVPFTVQGALRMVFDPVVLEMGPAGIRARGHRQLGWDEVRALRIEDASTRRHRVATEPQITGQSTRRLGIATHEPGGFSLLSTITGGRWSPVGITEAELPVRIETVIERARAYRDDIIVEGANRPQPATADPRAIIEPDARADAEPILWQGAPDPGRVLRRRLRATAARSVAEAAALIPIAFVLSSQGADAGEVFRLLLVFGAIIVGIPLAWSLYRTQRAVATSRHRRYTITESFVVVESAQGRHERRIATLPDLTLSMEGGGAGTIGYRRPRPRVPDWIRRLAPGDPAPDALLESIDDAQRVFALLESAKRGSAPAPMRSADPAEPPGGAGSAAAEAMDPEVELLPPRPGAWGRLGDFIPWWLGLFFVVSAVVPFGLGVGSPRGGAGVVGLGIGAVILAIGGLIMWADLRVRFTRRRVLRTGTRVMARVVGLADANARVNNVAQWTVRYEYEAGGRVHIGDSPMMSPGDASGWAAGDRVRIAYDPANSSVSVWLGGDPEDAD